MSAMEVIFTPSFPARRFLDVLVRTAIITFTILAVSWRLSRSSTPFSSAHDGVACPVTVHLPFFSSLCLLFGSQLSG